jgi:hypothetical protein
MTEFNIPTETVELPSQGKLYPESSPLHSGKVEMKYMTAKEEDILTNQNLIRSGEVIDRLLKSLIISKVNYDDLLIGDKNAIMLAARILSYGATYDFDYEGEKQSLDLSKFEPLPLHPDYEAATLNEFTFTLPHSGNVLTFKLLTHGDERLIDQEIKAIKKINKQGSNDVTARLSVIITSINDSRERKDIREFVNNYFLAKDAREFRKYYGEISPDIDMSVTLINGEGVEEEATLPITVNFFWPDA